MSLLCLSLHNVAKYVNHKLLINVISLPDATSYDLIITSFIQQGPNKTKPFFCACKQMRLRNYCKIRKLSQPLFSRIALKDIFATLVHSQLGHALPTLLSDSGILIFC